MTLLGLAIRNILRNKFRSLFTLLAVAIAVIAFVAIRTVLWAAGGVVEDAAKDRLITAHQVTFLLPLPIRYVEKVRQLPGIERTTYSVWFSGKIAGHEEEFFASMGVDTDNFLEVYDDLLVPPDQAARWRNEPDGAIVGAGLANKLGWKIGQKVTLIGTVYPGEWQFRVSAIYDVKTKAIDRASFFFHWKYLNNQLTGREHDQIGWFVSRIADPRQSAALSQTIDQLFESDEIQTRTQSERDFNNSFLAMVSGVFRVFDILSFIILAILLLILGNTIVMGVRERTGEYAVLRAIGFLPRHLTVLILGEGLVVAALGGLLGLGLSYLLVGLLLGRWLEENMGQFFPVFYVSHGVALLAFGLALLLGLLASLLPARGVSRLNVVNALRHTG